MEGAEDERVITVGERLWLFNEDMCDSSINVEDVEEAASEINELDMSSLNGDSDRFDSTDPSISKELTLLVLGDDGGGGARRFRVTCLSGGCGTLFSFVEFSTKTGDTSLTSGLLSF